MEELEQLGRYKLQRVLGRGAMGVVYEGVDPRLNRPVAVKTILKSQLSTPELAAEYQARFEREAQAVARLNHPNIVGVFDFGEENNVAYIVMELIRGDELKSYFDRKTVFSLADAVRMTSELLDALGYAHEQGIVHRDIKPANIMLDAQLRVKLTDFGVARLSEAGSEHTQAGTMVGTPSYMSPEQITGNPVGPRSDLFAAGIVLYQLLTGERPFAGSGHWAVQRQIVEEQPIPPSEINPDLDPALDAIVYRALAKDPESRYPYARAFKEDLRRVLDGRQTEIDDATLLVAASERKAIRRPADEGTARRGAPVHDEVSATEIEFWRTIKDSEDEDEFELYLAKFPAGTYAGLARRKLSKLRGETTGTGTAPIPSATDADARTILVKPGMTTTAGTPPAAKAGGKRIVAASAAVAILGLAAGVYVYMKPTAAPPSSVAAADKAPAPTAAVPVSPTASAPSSSPGATAAPAAAATASGATASSATAPRLPASPDVHAAGSSPAAEPPASASLQTATSPPAAGAEPTQRPQPASEASTRDTPARGAETTAPGGTVRNAANETEKSAKPVENEKPAKPVAAAPAERTRPETPPKPVTQATAEPPRGAASRASEATARRERTAPDSKAAAPAAAVSPAPPAPAPAEPPASVALAAPAASASPSDLLKQAQAQEQSGNLRQAISLYKRAAVAGSGSAAKTLGDIYGSGRGNIGRDYAESLRWYNLARSRGIDVPTVGVR